MNSELKKVKKWLDSNRLALNIGETNFLVFHPPHIKIPEPVIMNHYTRVHTCRIMGIILYAFHEPSISRVLLSGGSMELFTTT